jgi:acetyl-CoA acetyltransferase
MAKIVGVGCTDYSKDSERSTAVMAAQAILAALSDAGLSLDDVDGIGTFHLNDAAPTEAVLTTLDLPGVRWTLDWLGGGNLPSALVGAAADAVDAGRTKVAVCFRSMNGRSGHRLGGTGQQPSFAGVEQFYGPVGVVSYPQKFALWAQNYMIRYGLEDGIFAPIALTIRDHAVANPRAMRRSPLTREEYLASRWIVEPFRLLDICLETDGAVAVVVAADDVARHTRAPVAVVSHAAAMGPGAGQDLADLLYWNDLTGNYTALLRHELFGRAGVTVDDIDVAEIYDCFTYTVCLSMEGLGFCPPGTTPAWFEAMRVASGGRPAVNTHGGLLSEAYIHGMNHITEAVEQLRGEARGQQAPSPSLALVTSGAMTAGSALILGKE